MSSARNHKRHTISPKPANYGLSFVMIFEKINRVITALHYIWIIAVTS